MLSRKTYIGSAIAALSRSFDACALAKRQASASRLSPPQKRSRPCRSTSSASMAKGTGATAGVMVTGTGATDIGATATRGSGYWGHRYPPYFPPRPCSIFGGVLTARPSEPVFSPVPGTKAPLAPAAGTTAAGLIRRPSPPFPRYREIGAWAVLFDNDEIWQARRSGDQGSSNASSLQSPRCFWPPLRCRSAREA